MCWCSGMVSSPMRRASYPSRWLGLVWKRLTPLVTIGRKHPGSSYDLRRIVDGDDDRWRVLCGPGTDSAVVPIRGPHPVSLALAVPEEQNGGPHLWRRY